MCAQQKILENLRDSIVDGDDPTASTLTRQALEEGLSPVSILQDAILPGIETAGKLWQDGEYFMPDVILSAEAFKAASSVVEPLLAEADITKKGRVAIGVVAGDMHDLGVSIVMAMLQGAGFEVEFLGLDVSQDTFIERVRRGDIDILGIGAYMTTTMLSMKEVIETLKKENLCQKVKVMVGGVAVTQQFCDEIGADAWGKDALDTVAKAKQLLGIK